MLQVPGPGQPDSVPSCQVRALVSLAARGLVAMFDADKQLFCHRLLRTEQGLVREGLSPRYTIMTLLGLRELEMAGIDSGNLYVLCPRHKLDSECR
jgi:hypothetical protein